MACSTLRLNPFGVPCYLNFEGRYVFKPDARSKSISFCLFSEDNEYGRVAIFADATKMNNNTNKPDYSSMMYRADFLGAYSRINSNTFSVFCDYKYLLFDHYGTIVDVNYSELTCPNLNDVMSVFFMVAYRAEIRVFKKYLDIFIISLQKSGYPLLEEHLYIYENYTLSHKWDILNLTLVAYYSLENFRILIEKLVSLGHEIRIAKLFQEIILYLKGPKYLSLNHKDRMDTRLRLKAHYLLNYIHPISRCHVLQDLTLKTVLFEKGNLTTN